MTPDPTLTDEELARLEGEAIIGLGTRDARHLIAAYRAKCAEVERLRQCAVWALWHIEDEWPNGPTGDSENWERFLHVVGKPEGGSPPTLT